MSDGSTSMPEYRCHKRVWALQIQEIEENATEGGGAIITPVEDGYAPFLVPREYMAKHSPHVGGFYVVYKDGYKSFSPKEAFIEGYSPV